MVQDKGGGRAESAAVPGDDLGGRLGGADNKGQAGGGGKKADGAATGEALQS